MILAAHAAAPGHVATLLDRHGGRARAAGRLVARRMARAAAAVRPRLRRAARGARASPKGWRSTPTRMRANLDADAAACSSPMRPRRARRRSSAARRRMSSSSTPPAQVRATGAAACATCWPRSCLASSARDGSLDAAFDLAPSIAAAARLDRPRPRGGAIAIARRACPPADAVEPMPLIRSQRRRAVLRPDRAGRRAGGRVLELARHDAGDVGRAGARAGRPLSLPALRHARPRPLAGGRRAGHDRRLSPTTSPGCSTRSASRRPTSSACRSAA